jgi:hypothetical protein
MPNQRYAENIGFASWRPPTDDRPAGSYNQIYDRELGPDENPGSTGGSGSKFVEWNPDVFLGTSPDDASHQQVVLLAIPCLADNIPASSDPQRIRQLTRP